MAMHLTALRTAQVIAEALAAATSSAVARDHPFNVDPGDDSGGHADVPGDMADDPGVNERQQWIPDQLRAGGKLRRGDYVIQSEVTGQFYSGS